MAQPPLLARLRYRSLRLLSSWQRRLNRRFTPVGQWLLGGLLCAGVLGVDTNQTVAYQAFTFVLAAVVIAAVVTRARHQPFGVERILPRFATAGERLVYRITVRNHGRRGARGLTLAEDLGDPRPTIEEFLGAREPGEERRNRFDRAIGYFRWMWLVARKQMATASDVALPPLAPGGACEVRAELTPLRRGRLTLTGVSVARSDALGIARSTVTVPVSQSLLVLPRRYPAPLLELAGGRKYHQGGMAMATSVGDSEEFVALREYQPGDPLRRIHWRSWARLGTPIVKEHQSEFFVRHALVLDTFLETEPRDVFEEAVSVAASLACTTPTQESLLDLLFVGPEAYCFTAGRGLGHTERLLEVLACVRACSPASFRTLHRLVLEHQAQVSGCICVLVAWDDDRRTLVRALRALGVPTKVLLITAPGAPRTRSGWDGPRPLPPAGGRPDRRRAGAPVSTPPGLIGAAVLFWGWQTGLLLLALPIAAMLELTRVVPWRWDFTRREFDRLADLSTLLFVGAVVYFVLTGGANRAVIGVFQWLPVMWLPLVISQALSGGTPIELATLFWSLRGPARREGTGRQGINLAYPYFALCILSASSANVRDGQFYTGLCLLAAWALWSVRPRHAPIAAWAGAFVVVSVLGWGAHLGLHHSQTALEAAVTEWFGALSGRHDPFRTTTHIGQVGALKLGDRVVLRIEAGVGGPPPVSVRRPTTPITRPPGSPWSPRSLRSRRWMTAAPGGSGHRPNRAARRRSPAASGAVGASSRCRRGRSSFVGCRRWE